MESTAELGIIPQQESLADAWDTCERGDWMFWYLKRKQILTKLQSIELAIKCAERVLSIFEKKYPARRRPRSIALSLTTSTKTSDAKLYEPDVDIDGSFLWFPIVPAKGKGKVMVQLLGAVRKNQQLNKGKV